MQLTRLGLALLVGLSVFLPGFLVNISFLVLKLRIRKVDPEESTALVTRLRAAGTGVAGEGYWVPKSIVSGEAGSLSRDPLAVSIARVCIFSGYWLVVGFIVVVLVMAMLAWSRK